MTINPKNIQYGKLNTQPSSYRIEDIAVETFRLQLVTWLREQSVIYSSQARIAIREKVKIVAKAKSDSFEFAARQVETWQVK